MGRDENQCHLPTRYPSLSVYYLNYRPGQQTQLVVPKMRVLITGGAGFIGSHTCDIFYDAGYQVTILDNLNPKTHDNDWPTYLNKNFIKIKGDLCDQDLLLSLLKKNSIILIDCI